MLTSRGCPFSCSYCVDEDTKVLKIDKVVCKISDLKIGDNIVAFDEKDNLIKETIVKQIFSRNVTEYYEVKLTTGQILKVTEEHPIFTKRGWVKVKDLLEDDEVLVNEF